MRSLGGWLKGSGTTLLGGFALFAAYHALRFYVGLGWTIAIAALLALLAVIGWALGRDASHDDTRTG